MARAIEAHPPQRIALVRYTARTGAVTAEALAVLQRSGLASARSRLSAAAQRGLLRRHSPLSGQPALYTVTRAGLRACGPAGVAPARISAAGAAHAIACAYVAACLARSYPDQHVIGEPELRAHQRASGTALASATIALAGGERRGHRPDLVLCARDGRGLPVAVEVELTVKAPARLRAICRGWARCRQVAGVLYLASPDAERALRRAIDAERAGATVVVLPLGAVCAGA